MAHIAHHGGSAYLWQALEQIDDAEIARINTLTKQQLDEEMIEMGLDPVAEVEKFKAIVAKFSHQGNK